VLVGEQKGVGHHKAISHAVFNIQYQHKDTQLISGELSIQCVPLTKLLSLSPACKKWTISSFDRLAVYNWRLVLCSVKQLTTGYKMLHVWRVALGSWVLGHTLHARLGHQVLLHATTCRYTHSTHNLVNLRDLESN